MTVAKAGQQARLEELSVVAEVATAMLSSPLELKQVLDMAVEKVSRALDAHFGAITLFSRDRTFLEIAAVYNLAPDYGEKVRRTAPLRPDRSSPSGRAMLTLQPSVVTDVATDPVFAPWRQLAEEEGYRSMISVPMLVGAEAIGTLNQYLADPHEFTEGEIRLLKAISQQVCLAIERAHLYEQLKQQHELVRAASERKSRFVAALSHELRSPMTAIVGFAEVLLKQIPGPLNEAQRRQLRLLSSSAHHLLLLLNDVLDVAKIEAGKLDCWIQNVDAAKVVRETLDMMAPLAEAKGLSLEWQMPAQPLTLRCDPQRCKQILVNLVANAIKFTARGGVKVYGHRETSAAQTARISVSDTGAGMRPEDLPRLFQEFQQLGSEPVASTRGSGLGLSLSRQLARLMGGDIEVESIYGRGSTFTLRLNAE